MLTILLSVVTHMRCTDRWHCWMRTAIITILQAGVISWLRSPAWRSLTAALTLSSTRSSRSNFAETSSDFSSVDSAGRRRSRAVMAWRSSRRQSSRNHWQSISQIRAPWTFNTTLHSHRRLSVYAE